MENGDRKFNLFTATGLAGTYTVEQLRQMIRNGQVSRADRVGAVHEAGNQDPPVPVTAVPELADLYGQLAVPAENTPFFLPGRDAADARSRWEPEITRRSGWAIAFLGLGIAVSAVGVIAAFLAAVAGDRAGGAAAAVILAGTAGLALLFFFLSFLVNVFTDIRWFLKLLVDRQGGEKGAGPDAGKTAP